MTEQLAGHAGSRPFAWVDVFTDRMSGRNPSAVVLDADGLSTEQMQAVARETNLSETTFVGAPTQSDCVARVRIFTLARELPFAGHPTLGTAYVLATQGRLPDGVAETTLEEAISPVPVRFEGDPRCPNFLWMRHQDAEFGPTLEDRPGVARALGLAENHLLAGAPIRVGSTGAPFLYIPLDSPAAVDAAKLAVFDAPDAVGIFIFALDPNAQPAHVYARMFAPHTSGIPEDPATGGAMGALGAYLIAEGLVDGAGAVRILCEQGTKLGRQSLLHIDLHADAGRATEIWVGGSVVPVLTGAITIPGQEKP